MDADNDGLDTEIKSTGIISGGTDGEGKFFAVFDGMGGGQFGEIASYTVAARAKEFLERPGSICSLDVSQSVSELCLECNDAVYDESQNRNVNNMGSTLVGCYFYAGHVWTCNVGDSRCFRMRDGELEQVSVDHTDAQTMKLNGITGRKPYITQYLGIDRREIKIKPSVSRAGLRDGDIYLICSDGLTDMVVPEKILEILLDEVDEEEKVHNLLVEALMHGGRDNVTIIVCRVTEDIKPLFAE